MASRYGYSTRNGSAVYRSLRLRRAALGNTDSSAQMSPQTLVCPLLLLNSVLALMKNR